MKMSGVKVKLELEVEIKDEPCKERLPSEEAEALRLLCGGDSCRLCLTPATEMTVAASRRSARDYYGGGGEVSIADMVRTVTGIDVLDTRELGATVCEPCATAALHAYTFLRQCRAAHATLHHLLTRLHAALPDKVRPRARAAYLIADALRPHTLFDSTAPDDAADAVRRIERTLRRTSSEKEQSHETDDWYTVNKDANEVLLCEACGEEQVSRRELRRHVRQQHGADGCCRLCGTPAADERARREHVRTECSAAMPCSSCGRRFTHRNALWRHSHLAHSGVKVKTKRKTVNKFVCCDCGKMFMSGAAVRLHEETHRTRACVCGKAYKSRKTLAEHERTCAARGGGGVDAARFICDHCGKTFFHKQSLLMHVKTLHAPAKGFSCSTCGKHFRTKGQVKGHGVVHTRERPERCDVCGRRFITKYALLYHVRLHTGEKPHACSLCDERFVSSSRLAAHKRTRHWGPSEECGVCFSKFYTKYSLRVHTRRHYNPTSKLYCRPPDAVQPPTTAAPPITTRATAST